MRFLLLGLFALIAPIALAEDKPETAARTLDTVAIEGEIDVPQVLFISSRDHLRFHDDLADGYRPDPLTVIRGAVLPLRLRAVTVMAPPTISENDAEQAEPRNESPQADKE